MVGNILAVGLMSLGMGISGVKDEPQMYAQDEATYTITYENAEDWSNRAEKIYTFLQENDYITGQVDYSPLTVTGTANFTYNGNPQAEKTITSIGVLYNPSNTTRYISLANVNYNLDNQTWDDQGHELVLVNLTISNQEYYEAVKDQTMGNSIIGSIANGLGLIGALATEFLAGFGALFYDSGALTPFAIFSLVMLGVAVSFAVVKLVLNVIKSNTGA